MQRGLFFGDLVHREIFESARRTLRLQTTRALLSYADVALSPCV